MSIAPWEAGSDVVDLLNAVKEKNHHPRLEQARFALCFTDTKPFVKGRFNWGKVHKFSPLAKLWHAEGSKYDFLISLSGSAWHDVLSMTQREAWLDLNLTRCDVEFEPEVAIDPVTNKKQVVKDEWGRVQFSNNVKYDDDGVPKWKVEPLDLHVFAENVVRYGIWCEDVLTMKKAVQSVDEKSKLKLEAVC